MLDPGQCPDDETIAALAEGRLEPVVVEAIERHVDACAGCRELLATVGRGAQPDALLGRGALIRGDTIGRYTILERIGAGGMGVVYTAYDHDLDRRVALKVLREDVMASEDGAEATARMLREAKSLARVAHPNVVNVFQVAKWSGQIYMALEYVEGHNLSEWLELVPRSVNEILDVFRQAGVGLAAVHAAGLIHRDFKPGNVLIGTDGRARVADFGLARLTFADGAAAAAAGNAAVSLLTTGGRVMGTPAYMSPEQLNAQHVDARADQFAFCVALFEALFGARPFEGADLHSLLINIESSKLRAVKRARVTPTIFKAIKRGLSADPAARFSSMLDLIAGLTPPPPRRFGAVIVAALATATAAGVALFTVLGSKPSPEQIAAVEARIAVAREAAAEERYLYPPVDDPTANTAYRLILALERIEDESRRLAQTEARSLRSELAQQLVTLGDEYWDRPGGRGYAVDFYATALVFDPDDEQARERAALTPGELAALRVKADELAFTPAELEAAEPLAALAEPETETRADRLRKIAQRAQKGHAQRADLGELLEDLERTRPPKKAGRRDSDPDPPSPPAEPAQEAKRAPTSEPLVEPEPERPARDAKKAASLVGKGRAQFGAGNFTGAEKSFHQALDADPRSHAALIGLGDVSFERGRYGNAVSYSERAVRRAPKRADYRVRLGDALQKNYRYADARQQYQRAADLGSRVAQAKLGKLEAKLGEKPKAPR